MNYPELSVIIPTYNNGPEIEKAVISVLKQDAFVGVDNWVEIIIVNDCSEEKYLDNFQSVADKYPSVRLFHNEKRGGPGVARNNGIRRANGRLISFLDADDEWPLNKLTLLLPYLENENVDIVGGKVKFFIPEGMDYPIERFEDEVNKRLTHVNVSALLMRKSLFDRGFYFDEVIAFSEDTDWWMRLRENNINIVMTEETTLLYYIHGENLTLKNKDLRMLEVLHKSLQRRRANNLGRNIPQLKDFRTERTDALISVILPLYNGKSHVKRALDSVLMQTYGNLEVLVVDDGSTDDSVDFVAGLYTSVKIIRQVHAGITAARNNGITACSGDLIAFLDQDDEWVPSKLLEQWAILKNKPYIAFVTCNQLFKRDESVSLPRFLNEELQDGRRAFGPGSLLVRKHALLTIGGFDERREAVADTDIVRRLRDADFAFENVDSVLLYKWYHGNNTSPDK